MSDITHIGDLTPDPENARQHTPRNVGMIEDAMNEVGAARSIVIDEDGVVLAGNATIEAAAQAGIERVKTVHADGNTIIAVVRDNLTPEQKKRLALFDNRTAELAEWNEEELAALLDTDFDFDRLWYEDELSELLADVIPQEPPGDPGAAMSRAEELCEKWDVVRGKRWQVGRHYVMCGDAYKDIDALLDGVEPDMMHIDPPYGIDIIKPSGNGSAAAIGGAKPFGATSGAARKSGAAERSTDVGRTNPANIVQSNYYAPIEGDDRPFDPTAFLDVARTVIMWGANNFAHMLPPHQCWIVWDKRENITRNTFADCEIAWTNQDSPARLFHHLWNGLHKGSQHGERRTHPTEKPVALFEEIGRMYADGGVWLDCFAGTGAQVVAAERTGATCYALEFEPTYTATILQRLTDMGLDPRLVE